jgi:hypothetical protein
MYVQRLVSVVKMATVFEVYITEEQSSIVRFLWAKGLNTKDIHKKIFPVYGGKGLSSTEVHNWAKKRGIISADDEEVETEVRKWLRQQTKHFYTAGFDALVK